VNAVNAPEAWAHGYTGEGVVVAVVDTGVDWNHPDLASQIWVNVDDIAGNGLDDDHNGFVDDVRGWDFSFGDNNPDDGNGHGTHVAGTIAAERNGFGATGIAPDATIMPVRVLGNNGSGTAQAVAAGIRYAAQNGADIINLSLGGALSTAIQSAIQFAQSLNVLVVAAAGNEYAATPGYPARFSSSMNNVLSVGAHSSSNQIASFSNDVGASGAVQVDAPGANVYSTYAGDGYARLSGTSMATPHVAGLAALALSANPSLSASALRTLIVDGANRAISGSDSRGGINAALTVAMAAAGQVSASPSTVAAQGSSATGSISGRRFNSASAGESLAALAFALAQGSVPADPSLLFAPRHDQAMAELYSSSDIENRAASAATLADRVAWSDATDSVSGEEFSLHVDDESLALDCELNAAG
jgi:subtilisin family serine protease